MIEFRKLVHFCPPPAPTSSLSGDGSFELPRSTYAANDGLGFWVFGFRHVVPTAMSVRTHAATSTLKP